MALPSSYTETTFAQFLHRVLRDLADMLSWSVEGGDFDEIINDTLSAYGVDAISSATNIPKLRALGKLALWEAVLDAAIPEINYTADGTTMNREAIFQHVERKLNTARIDAMPYLPESGYSIEVLSVHHDDPYRWDDPYEETE